LKSAGPKMVELTLSSHLQHQWIKRSSIVFFVALCPT